MTGRLSRPVGAILAGGRATRMGADKALIEVGGMPLILWTATAVKTAGCEPLVVGRGAAPGGIPARPDDVPGRAGPAAGLVTALRLADGRDVFLTAADQPFLRAATVRRLLSRDATIVLPVDDGTLQTTCAVYRAGCLPPLRELMANDPSPPLKALCEVVVDTRPVPPHEWRAWGEDGRSWWSIDTPAEVKKAERWLEKDRETNRDPG